MWDNYPSGAVVVSQPHFSGPGNGVQCGLDDFEWATWTGQQFILAMCTSGGRYDCNGNSGQALCKTNSNIQLSGPCTMVYAGAAELYRTTCPVNYVMTEFCSGGAARDCSNGDGGWVFSSAKCCPFTYRNPLGKIVT